MRKLVAVLVAAFVAAFAIATVAVAGKDHHNGHPEAGEKGPDRIALPNGYRPEGVAAGKGRSIFVGSIPTGRVLEIDTKTGTSREAVPERDGHAAIGLKYAKHEQWLFVSGGATGKGYVYDARTGAELAALQLTAAGQEAFINDVALGRHAAYFTDSRQPVIYAVKRDLSGVTPIPLTGFPMTAGNNLNGIETVKGGRLLLAIQSSQGVLWRIDPATGAHVPVDLHGANLANGDGILMVGKRKLLVVQNRLNQIAVVKLDKGYNSGRVVKTVTNPGFDVPTTVAFQRDSLYLPSARFTTPPTPDTEYWVTRVGKPNKQHRHQ